VKSRLSPGLLSDSESGGSHEVTAREHAGACGNWLHMWPLMWPHRGPVSPEGATGRFGQRSARPYPGARFTAYLAL